MNGWLSYICTRCKNEVYVSSMPENRVCWSCVAAIKRAANMPPEGYRKFTAKCMECGRVLGTQGMHRHVRAHDEKRMKQ